MGKPVEYISCVAHNVKRSGDRLFTKNISPIASPSLSRSFELKNVNNDTKDSGSSNSNCSISGSDFLPEDMLLLHTTH